MIWFVLIPIAIVVVFGLYHVFKGDNHNNQNPGKE